MALTEFYVTGAGSNLNAGSTTANAAAFTYTSDLVAGWNAGTGVFTVAGGAVPNTDMPAMANGDHYGSVYVTAGATVATFVARITAVSATTITVSLTAKSGTPPATDLLGATTLKVDGAWLGMSGTTGFPFNFWQGTMTNSNGDVPRINIISSATFSMTGAITHSTVGPGRVQGYTTTPGDGGRWTLTGATGSAGYVPLSITTNVDLWDTIITNNGNTTGSAGLSISGICHIVRVKVSAVRGIGLAIGGTSVLLEEVEVTGWNQNAGSNVFGISVASNSPTLRRCVVHDATGSTTHGIEIRSGTFIKCHVYGVGGKGFLNQNSNASGNLEECESYNNGSDGYGTTGSWKVSLTNCNAVRNGGYGLNLGSGTVIGGRIVNMGFGSGATYQNTSGTINHATIRNYTEEGTITYTTHPYADPTASPPDFRITSPEAKNKGYGVFPVFNVLGYPDVGALQADGGGVIVVEED